jgi:hypothetical protein
MVASVVFITGQICSFNMHQISSKFHLTPQSIIMLTGENYFAIRKTCFWGEMDGNQDEIEAVVEILQNAQLAKIQF